MEILSHIDEDKIKIIFIVALSVTLISIMFFISEDMKNEVYSFKKYSLTPGASIGESCPPICKIPDGVIICATVEKIS